MAKNLLVDLSSRKSVVIDTASQQVVHISCLSDIYLRSAYPEGTMASRYLASDHLISDLRESFPYIEDESLRDAIWANIVKQIVEASIREMNFPAEIQLRMHAVFPQLWGTREVQGFRAASTALGCAPGRIFSETVCLVPVLTFRLEDLCLDKGPDPLKLTVLFCEGEECRWWSFHLFRSCSPMCLRLTDYAPGWCVNYGPPQTASATRVVVLGEKEHAMKTLARMNFCGERLVENPSDTEKSALLKGALHLLRIIDERQRWPAPELRLEMAPRLGWRFGSNEIETVVSPDMLLDQANFPFSPALTLECAASPESANWPQINFRLEAGWGQSPKSWAPLASLSLSGTSARNAFPEDVTLCLKMNNCSEGEASLLMQNGSAAASVRFKLVSAIA